MSLPENDYQILKLTDDFYNTYPNPPYTEIDKDEYNETMINLEKIKAEALTFVEEYVSHIKGEQLLHQKEFARRYSFSTLKYFHAEMGI